MTNKAFNYKDYSWEDHLEAYDLYLKIVDVLDGEKLEIAILALLKCRINLEMALHDYDTPKNQEVT